MTQPKGRTTDEGSAGYAGSNPGRWQASYIGPDGNVYIAPSTFDAKIDAEGWLPSAPRDRPRAMVAVERAGGTPKRTVR